jgi:hypothetical protein
LIIATEQSDRLAMIPHLNALLTTLIEHGTAESRGHAALARALMR